MGVMGGVLAMPSFQRYGQLALILGIRELIA